MSSQIDKSKINSPSHYNIEGELETIKKMEQYMSIEELIAWCKGCIFTYIDRAKYKNGLEDLYKAMWHVNYILLSGKYGDENVNTSNILFFPNHTYNKLKTLSFYYLNCDNFIATQFVLQSIIDNYVDL